MNLTRYPGLGRLSSSRFELPISVCDSTVSVNETKLLMFTLVLQRQVTKSSCVTGERDDSCERKIERREPALSLHASVIKFLTRDGIAELHPQQCAARKYACSIYIARAMRNTHYIRGISRGGPHAVTISVEATSPSRGRNERKIFPLSLLSSEDPQRRI